MFFHNTLGLSVGGLFSPQYAQAPWSFGKLLDLLAHLPVPLLVECADRPERWLIVPDPQDPASHLAAGPGLPDAQAASAAARLRGPAPGLLATLGPIFSHAPVRIHRGATWTTDAPFRETASALAHCRDLGIMAVEMEAAALYAFANATQRPVVCIAHVTNRMARSEGDFEKGVADGSQEALHLVALLARAWRAAPPA